VPVSLVAQTDAAAPTAPRPPADPSGGGDFAAALAAATSEAQPATTSEPAQLRSVPLGEMVEAYASSSSLGAPPNDTPLAGAPDPYGAPAVGPVSAAGGVGGAATAATGAGARVLAAGERYLGVPYKWGGTDPATGFDCSGFVQRAFADVGVSLPRVSVDQARQGTAVPSMDQARPGDLVFWNGDGSRPNHIGIYAGEGRMLVAPRTGDVVRYQDITREPHSIRRVL
jgi:peptidoglycan DL-endopeptidase CwlO